MTHLIYNGKKTEYMIDSNGNVYRYGKLKKTNLNSKGYRRVTISKNGKCSNIFIHKALAETFIYNPENKLQVNHKDGNKLNNHIENLEWVSNQENRDHAIEMNLHAFGERCGSSKLSEEDVIWIRNNYKPYNKNNGFKPLLKKYNIQRKTLWDLLNFNTWKNI